MEKILTMFLVVATAILWYAILILRGASDVPSATGGYRWWLESTTTISNKPSSDGVTLRT